MKKVLVVEDEYAIRDLVTLNLKLAGYEVLGAESAEHGLELYNEAPESFGIALLDIMLPGMSGLELCGLIRKENSRIGIIMLTARTQEEDKIEGLATGADDYVTKPFSIKELVARVDAICRRISASSPASREGKKLISGDFVLDTNSRILTKNGKELNLTQVEYQIMELFMKNQNTALDRNRILTEIWGDNYYGDIKIVDVNIRRLRMKVEDVPSDPKYLTTVWGFGYKWVQTDETA